MFIEIDGLKIKYKFTGEGEQTVVILQGWGTSMEIYDSVAAVLSPKYRVLQFDLPGFGGSSEPEKPWNVERFTLFFCALMKKLDINKMTIFAHSYGGRIVLKLFEKGDIPFEIDRLIMCDAAGIVREKTKAQKKRIARYKRLKKL